MIGAFRNDKKGKELYLSVSSFYCWSTSWGHCKLRLTINTNQVKCWFFEERGNRSTRSKPLNAEKRTNKLNPHMTPDLWIEPGPHWWDAKEPTHYSIRVGWSRCCGCLSWSRGPCVRKLHWINMSIPSWNLKLGRRLLSPLRHLATAPS